MALSYGGQDPPIPAQFQILFSVRMADGSHLPGSTQPSRYGVREVVDNLVKITGFSGEIDWQTDRPEGQSRRVFDMSKTKQKLDFVCETSLHDGLMRTVDWYRANRTTARNLVAAPG